MSGGWPKRRFRMAWLLVGCGMLAATGVGAPACSSDDSKQEVPQLGQMALDLTATDASGARYRLRNGVFEITAFSSDASFVVSTEDDPNATTIDIELAADVYSVFLRPGYYLEQVSFGGEGGEGGEGGGTTVGSVSSVSGSSTTTTTGGPDLKRLSDLVSFRSQHPKSKARVQPTRTVVVAPTSRDELPRPVDTELVSDNPATAQVSPNETTPVDFVFSLEPGARGDGELSIGIDVIGAGSTDCEPDDFEPNDSPDQAPLVELDPPFTATACEGDQDYYLFESPVAEGEAFSVVLDFVHAQGDIDCALIDNEGNVVSQSTGITDQEQLVATSNGGQYLLLAYPFSGAASYTVSVGTANVSDCCAASPLPTCSEPEVSACVCAIDSFCCDVAFDEICAQISLQQCGGSCPLGEGSCCEASDGPGCADQEVQDCVCGIDMQCCTGSFDDLCVEEAVAACGLTCEMPEPDSDCCTPGENPSCTDPVIAECTCGVDPFCCAHPFDENCVSIAAGFCGAECGGL